LRPYGLQHYLIDTQGFARFVCCRIVAGRNGLRPYKGLRVLHRRAYHIVALIGLHWSENSAILKQKVGRPKRQPTFYFLLFTFYFLLFILLRH
jgi:hypothetical protein